MNIMKRIFRFLGPGFITGASDDDPSGVVTYAQTGAQFGLHQSWVTIYTIPFMYVIQEMCGRIGILQRTGLAGTMRKFLPNYITIPVVLLLVTVNSINVGANIGAMTAVVAHFVPIPKIYILLSITISTVLLMIFVPYTLYAKYLKILSTTLLLYVATLFFIKFDVVSTLKSLFTPWFNTSSEYLMNLVALLGTTISPYLFFWQSDEDAEEQRIRIKQHTRKLLVDVNAMKMDTFIGMVFSQLVAGAIVITASLTLHTAGITQIETADQAALALRPLAGDMAYILFSLGIISTGLLSLPVLSGAGAYAFSEMLGWRVGLSKNFSQARYFYILIAAITAVGAAINIINISAFRLLYYTAVINGIAAPFILSVILWLSNNKKVVGSRTNDLFSNLFGALSTIFMFAAAVFFIISEIGFKK